MLLSCLSCLLLFLTVPSHSMIICLSSSEDTPVTTDDNECTIRMTSMANLSSAALNNTIVYFETNHIFLNKNIVIQDVVNVTLMGKERATIECSHDILDDDVGYGLTFVRVTKLHIINLSIMKCGVLHNSTTTNTSFEFAPQLFRSGIYMINCSDIHLLHSNITDNIGVGLAMFDCNSVVNVSHCTFSNNKVYPSELDIYSGGNGLYIEFTYCSPDWYNNCDYTTNIYNSDSDYYITDTIFHSNTVTRRLSQNPSAPRLLNFKNSFKGVGKGGGGISIFVKGGATRNRFEFQRVTFQNNEAGIFCYGGGVFLQFQDNVHDNHFLVENCTFDENIAEELEGGALNLGFILMSDTFSPFQNHIVVKNTTFSKNRAKSGGAILLFSSPWHHDPNNTIVFENCSWSGNMAETGAAALISAIDFLSSSNNILPIPKFIDCNFTDNSVDATRLHSHGSTSDNSFLQLSLGSGTLFVKLFTILFEGNTLFKRNNGSCIYSLDSEIRILSNSKLSFVENKGNQGGALSLIGLSSVNIFGDNVTLIFINNTAYSKGGAIYSFSIDKTSTRYFGLCFIQLKYSSGNYTFIYEGNKAIWSRGNSIYVSSLLPCVLLCNRSNITNISPEESFKCIGDMRFINSNFRDEVATDGTVFKYTSKPKYIIPGKPTKLPAIMEDEIGNNLNTTLLQTKLMEPAGELRLVNRHTSNYNITLTGNPNDTGTVHVYTLTFHNVSFMTDVRLSECPPGFILDQETSTCRCSAVMDRNNYKSIFACNNKEFQAVANIGYWIGYIPVDSPTPFNLYTGTCPLGYCYTTNKSYIILPEHPSSQELDEILCLPENRTGILCGECIANHSVYYHSYRYTCGPDTHCHLGFLFYLLSEILPLTIIFGVTIIFRVNFTSGYLNGFVLFAQLLDSLSLSANGGVSLEESHRTALQILHVIYSPFNLDLFHIEPLSFCLFKGFNFLQIASMRFLTIVIALVLVLVLVFVMRCSWCYKLQLACFKVKLTNSASLINGLSAFLVLTYGLCCRSCYRILNMAWLQGINSEWLNTPRVFRMGGIEYFSKEHVPYALLAIVFFIMFVIIPTLFLLLQPLSYYVLPVSFLNTSKVRFICSKVESLSPLFDTFQGCFKDKYRFFAGLYLLYRSIASGTFALINARFEVYITTEVILVLMLAIHSWAQPYRIKIHNHIDTAIFLNMIVINTLTIFRYYETKSQTNLDVLRHVTNFQLFLVYLPVGCLIVMSILYWSRNIWKKKSPKRGSEILPELILTREKSYTFYKEFKDDDNSKEFDVYVGNTNIEYTNIDYRTALSD